MNSAHGNAVTLTRRWLALVTLSGVLASISGCSLLSWSEPRSSHHAPARSHVHAKPSATPSEYTVEKGDTLYSIAFRNQVDYHDLASWNDIGRDYLIQVGQRLRLTPPAGIGLPPPGSAAGTVASAPLSSAPKSRNPPTTSPIASNSTATAGVSAPPSSGSDSDSAVGAWLWPTQGNVVDRFDPDGGQKGVDIGGTVGQIVVASAPGKVVYSGSALKGYGELVIVKHNETYLSAYGYNRRRLVEEGQQVTAGQPIAELGMGPEQKPVLHFEIRDKGRPIDPLTMLPRR